MRKLILAVLVLLVFVGSGFLYTYHLRTQARRIIENSYELSNSKTAPTLGDIQSRYGKRLRLEGCVPSFGCTYEIKMSNGALAALRILPYTELRSSFWVNDGVVQSNMVDYMITVKTRNVMAHVEIDYCPRADCNSFSLHPWSDGAALDTNGYVAIGSRSSAAKKSSVLSLNTSCLAKLHGCTTVADLLPTVWQRNENDTINCRIANREGYVDRPSDWTWMK